MVGRSRGPSHERPRLVLTDSRHGCRLLRNQRVSLLRSLEMRRHHRCLERNAELLDDPSLPPCCLVIRDIEEITDIRQFGRVRNVRDHHRRVVPDGQTRRETVSWPYHHVRLLREYRLQAASSTNTIVQTVAAMAQRGISGKAQITPAANIAPHVRTNTSCAAAASCHLSRLPDFATACSITSRTALKPLIE